MKQVPIEERRDCLAETASVALAGTGNGGAGKTAASAAANCISLWRGDWRGDIFFCPANFINH